ncbi:iron uptake porin [Pantanalinema rosaneae CENA516]|uniref:iron uptake porin n=1 Tax=Pantanalinema rosaneae TaxID=1620701 RepID=UPI003D6DDF02
MMATVQSTISQRLWLSLLTVFAVMGLSPQAQAVESGRAIVSTPSLSTVTSEVAEPSTIVAQARPLEVMEAIPSVSSLAATPEALPTEGMEQVTSVSQLTDVRPTDWAFQALQSLVERYGCIVGYPDRTYRGNRAMTRYEFAAGLNACMDKIQELIAGATGDLVRKEDLLALQRLQEEFAAELATLRGRVDSLDVRTATLEKQQFSTTTKLNGLAWMNLTGAGAGDDVNYEGIPGVPPDVRFAAARSGGDPIVLRSGAPQTTLSFLTWLTLNTSFTGRDLLVTTLAAGNGISPANQYASAGFFNSFGSPFTDQSANSINGDTTVIIRDFFYQFPVNDSLKVAVGPRINWYRHFDFNRFTFFLTGAGSFDSIGSTQSNAIDRGSGAVVEWTPSSQFRIAAGYLGENTEFLPNVPGLGFNTSSDPNFGLFGGSNTSTFEVTYSPTSTINLRFLYNYSRLQAVGGQVGNAVGEPLPYGFVDAGPGFSELLPDGSVAPGGLKYAFAHHLAFNFDWLITPGFGIFGRYGYATTTLKPINKAINVQSFQVGLGFPDLGKRGALATLTFLMPMDILHGKRYFASGAGDGGTMYELEASYYYPVTDNIAIVPSVYAIFNANNFNDNPTIFVGNIRGQFSF